MGVPKFFRYISERYPSLSELVRENQIPEFDNLYLDMNGIIHVCSHPNDFDPHFRISEEKIFNDICRYIEILFRMIQPQKLFLMAIDGVAPRAKMNQQRGRRFRSAKEAQTLENDAKSKGELLPTEARFDSNCITPGTTFMVRLQEHLKYFVKAKLSTDALWQKCRVVLSGQETPGEGEHKIMEYIRYLKASPGYDPDTRHCLYGLDADLIMLGLCSHEPHFSLLREEVKFGKQANKRLASAEETRFFLLHLSLLREYLEQEFWPIKDNLPFPYDIESIIDDWVLMGFLVGNDFVPHLPHLHIQTNALPMLYDAYMKIIPTLDGYINEGGILNLSRLEEFMSKLAHVDRDNFQDINGDLKYFEGKRAGNPWKKTSQNDSETFDVDVASIKAAPSDLQALIQATEDMFLDESPEGESNDEYPAEDIRYKKKKDIMDMTDEEVLDEEFALYKRDYYITKLGYPEVTPEVLAEQAECYVRALQWILLYYYRGVRSWGWFYPHHYAPFISDISGFKHLKLDFLMGKPFLPFQQLLAVLPAASGTLLPEAYRNLMVSPDSPVIHYYPSDFQTDMNGKQQEWEAVVLIPFIEENLLLSSMKKCESNLTPEEVARNIHGPMLQYDYNPIDQGRVSGKDGFPDLPHNFSTETKVSRSELEVPTDRLVLGPCKGAKFDVFFPGFPTMKHLKYTSRLEKKAVKVFDQPSRGHNMIISITHEEGDVAYNIAKDILGKNIFVAWPHLMEAKVISVSDPYKRYHYSQESGIRTEENAGNLKQQWTMSIKNTTDHYMNRLGVDVGKTSILVHVLTMIGRKYVFGNKGKITLEKQFTTLQSTYPYQACVRDISVNDPTFVQYKSINEVFSSGLTVFMLGYPHYGCTGEVVDVNPNPKECRIRLSILRKSEPDLTIAQQIYREISSQYMTGHEAASKLGFSSYIVGRITGTVYIIPGEKTHRPPLETTRKINVGLNLKFTKKNEEISGYCRKVGPAWLYSFSTVKLISDYMDKYPQLFQLMGNKNINNDVFYEYDLFPNEKDKGKLSELVKWLKEQPHSSAERRPCGSEAASKPCIEEIMKAVHSVKNSQMRKIVLLVKPVHLYVPGLERTSMPPDPKSEFKMFDRVTNVRESYTVPLGQTGTVVATHLVIDPNPVHQNSSSEMLVDVLFDEPFPGGSSFEGIAEGRLFRMPLSALVNISYGERMETNSQKVSTHNASNKNSVENKTAKENMDWRSRDPVVEAKGSLETVSARTPNVMNSSDVSSTKYQTLWNDLHKKQQENTNVPIQNNSTVILKQMLGVSVQDARNNSIPFLPRAQQQQQPPPPQQQQPTNVNMSVQDFFNQARANTVVAPVLPQPPHQWYGYPPGVDNVQNWRQHSSPPRQQGAQSPRRHPQEYNVSNSMHKPLNQSNSPVKSIQYGLVQNLQQQADRQFSNHPISLTAGAANPNQNTSSQQRHYSSHSNTLSDHMHKTSGHNRQTHTNANNSSAFIPLQAIKKERLKSASSAQIQNQRPRTSDELNRQSRQDTSHKRQVVEQKQQASQQQFQKYLHTSQPTDGKKDTRQPMIPSERKVRKSRIAANFGPTE